MARGSLKRNPDMARRLVRLRGGRTLDDVSASIGCGLSTLQTYESEGRIPDGDTLLRLASYYGVTAEYLLHGEQSPTTAVAQDVEMYRRLNLSERRIVDQVAELLLAGDERTKADLRQVVELVRRARAA